MSREEWRPVLDFKGLYEVSNLGRVKSLRTEKIIAGSRSTLSPHYRAVTLSYPAPPRDVKYKYVHIEVLQAFVCLRPEGLLALHKDGNVLNCELTNLYWGTPQMSAAERIRHGRSGRGEKNPNSTLVASEVRRIKQAYAGGGVKQSTLGDLYGVSHAHISRIIRGKSWSTEL